MLKIDSQITQALIRARKSTKNRADVGVVGRGETTKDRSQDGRRYFAPYTLVRSVFFVQSSTFPSWSERQSASIHDNNEWLILLGRVGPLRGRWLGRRN